MSFRHERSAVDPVKLDTAGKGETSACAMTGDIEIVVVKRDKSIFIPHERVTVIRAGDGLPVRITAIIP